MDWTLLGSMCLVTKTGVPIGHCPFWRFGKTLGANSWRTLHGHGSLGGEFQTCFIFNHRHGMMTPNTRMTAWQIDWVSYGFLELFAKEPNTTNLKMEDPLLLWIRYEAMLLAIFNFLKRAIFNWVLLLLGVNKQLNEQYFLCSFYFQASHVRLPWGNSLRFTI
jgi:hypothetical protein